ncbi:MAG: prepilin-type N-terminal cleavage/methylation domain-containing protein [Candidatus Colwellbacteria bacterium]|nr:prepilin-type N-terminal cleavage/methylation domain-containing protein [Candidatus Colwellbacteria bacterium]MBI3088742.1 prepilin-type N-terminal cleavage/methylation domain-containing protein [Candidatus Colwellbacteria bacterium]
MSFKKIDGFSLAELLVAISIMAIIAAVGFSSFAGFRNKKSVEGEVTKLVAVAREVMELSKSQTDGSGWGLHLANPTGAGNDFYEVWKGASYASGTTTERLNLGGSVGFTDPADGATKDIIFAKVTGLPTASTTIIIQSLTGGGTATINIDSWGKVDYVLN